MNCWKTINLEKHYGIRWIKLISALIGMMTFIVLYIPFSMYHQDTKLNESLFIIFFLAIICLPTIHSFMHILPLIILNRKIKVKSKKRIALFSYTFYTDSHLQKKTYILSAISPTILLTVPGLIATILFPSIYVYCLMATSFNIGLSFIDFLSIRHILTAPKNAYVENGHEGFDILLKAE
jgi:Putative zincin peptidase